MSSSRCSRTAAPLAVLGLLGAWQGSAEDSPPSGRQIMQWVEDRDDGDDSTADLRMTLLDKRGNERVRTPSIDARSLMRVACRYISSTHEQPGKFRVANPTCSIANGSGN